MPGVTTIGEDEECKDGCIVMPLATEVFLCHCRVTPPDQVFVCATAAEYGTCGKNAKVREGTLADTRRSVPCDNCKDDWEEKDGVWEKKDQGDRAAPSFNTPEWN